MPGQLYAPLTITGGYGTTTANIDEWPPLGDRIQSANINSGATVSGEVTFDASASLGFGRICFSMAHLGNATGGWSVSAQLKVAGANVGTPVIVARPGFSGIYKHAHHIFPASASAAVAANPSAVSVSWVATNLHASQQQHWIDGMALVVGPDQPQPVISGIDWDDVVEAWDVTVSHCHSVEGGAVWMVPALKGGAHLVISNGTATWETDVADTGIIQFTSGWYGSVIEIEAGLDDSWEVHVLRTPATLPTSDATSQVAISCHANQVKGANAVGVPGYKLVVALAMRDDNAGGGWIRFVGSVESESNHIRSNDTPAVNTRYLVVARNQQSGNEELYRAAGPDPMVAGDRIIDQDAADETNKRWSVGVGRREDGSRQWMGGWEATWILNGELTQAQALAYANTIGALHGLVEGAESGSGGAATAINVDTAAFGSQGFAKGVATAITVDPAVGGGAGLDFTGGVATTITVDTASGGLAPEFPDGGIGSTILVDTTSGYSAGHRGQRATAINVVAVAGGAGSETPHAYSGPYVGTASVRDDPASVNTGG